MQPASRWTGRSHGGYWPLWVAITLMRLAGRLPVLVLSHPVGVMAMLCAPRLRAVLLRYRRLVRPDEDRCTACCAVARHLAHFGRQLCDRMLAYTVPQQGAHLRMRLSSSGLHHLRAALQPGTASGAVLVSAHLGNWELAGRLIHRLLRPDQLARVHYVMVEAEPGPVRELLERHMGDRSPQIIDPRDPLAAAAAIHTALGRGDCVGMLGDRLMPGQPSARVRLLGRPIAMPVGALLAAGLAGKPVLCCFFMKRGEGAYHLHVEPPWPVALPPRGAGRQQAVAALAQRWADLLGALARRHPLQWNNYFDLWMQQAALPTPVR